MSGNRSLKLLDTLTLSEKRDFDFVMESVSRKSLRNLYQCIKNDRNKTEDKEVLYKKVFGERYTPAKDYLLRNELRLLTDKIKGFLVSRQCEEEIRENSSYGDWLLQKSLLKHQLYKEYEAEFKKSYKKAIDNLSFDMAQRMLGLRFNYLMTQPKINVEMIAEAHSILLENLGNIKYRYRTDVSINQQGRVAMEAFLNAFGKQVNSSAVGVDTDVAGYLNPYIEFFEYSALANQTGGDEKIKFAELAEQSIGKVEDIFPNNRVDGLAMLAGAYYNVREYATAAKYYEKALSFKDKNKLPIRNDILFNYVSTLMKLDDYARAVDIMMTYDKSIQANPKVKHKFDYFHCMAHIFMGSHKHVREIIPQNIGRLPEDEHHYFRFIYCILPYLDDDIEDAIREVTNFIAYFNHHGDTLAFAHEKGFAQVFKNFFEVIGNAPSANIEQNEMLSKVSSSLEELLVQHPQYADYLYIKWLKQQLAK